MTAFDLVYYQLIGLVIFRVTVLAVGALFAVLGYQLFKFGYFEKAGELKAAWGDKNIALKQVAPGIFFAFFGALLTGVATWGTVTFEIKQPAAIEQPSADGVRSNTEFLATKVLPVLQKVASSQQLNDADKSTLDAAIASLQSQLNGLNAKRAGETQRPPSAH